MDKMHNQISNIEFIGTDKIGFIVTAKIASSTLDGIKEKYDFRKDFPTWDLSNIETVTTLPEIGSLEKFI